VIWFLPLWQGVVTDVSVSIIPLIIVFLALQRYWRGQRIVLRFDGVDSCARVWLNGIEIGITLGSRLPARRYSSAVWPMRWIDSRIPGLSS
jgi:hypothetical protein